MRKTLYALVLAAGTFAVVGGMPASAMSPAQLAPITDVADVSTAITKVHWHHHHHHWGPYWGWGYYRPYRPYCWWSYGVRHCRY
jgi:hypothetical protein